MRKNFGWLGRKAVRRAQEAVERRIIRRRRSVCDVSIGTNQIQAWSINAVIAMHVTIGVENSVRNQGRWRPKERMNLNQFRINRRKIPPQRGKDGQSIVARVIACKHKHVMRTAGEDNAYRARPYAGHRCAVARMWRTARKGSLAFNNGAGSVIQFEFSQLVDQRVME